ncbi:hemerythrin domain-containing protein [Desulfovibrio oxamicus]|uniref:Hemerythrin domain-containing protein n=1 Tax=Nitratidesulfovibrio oxamicus TaxID=32016 RepID=A0ABS0J911_9BACT|nr:hemerythrin domain-containing protein [Nitratidesulfovibrio oxamicus]MBG3878645.1 hemerythrin domain-containing protein [Nitratidesulfovibrio oxamicus]
MAPITAAHFIRDLKDDHQRLLDTLEEARRLGLGTAEGRHCLFTCKELLTRHLRKEDTMLYPALRQAAGKGDLGNVADAFASEMQSISGSLLEFFARYDAGAGAADAGAGGLDFARELGRIIIALKMRIQREESRLYPAYEKARTV